MSQKADAQIAARNILFHAQWATSRMAIDVQRLFDLHKKLDSQLAQQTVTNYTFPISTMSQNTPTPENGYSLGFDTPRIVDQETFQQQQLEQTIQLAQVVVKVLKPFMESVFNRPRHWYAYESLEKLWEAVQQHAIWKQYESYWKITSPDEHNRTLARGSFRCWDFDSLKTLMGTMKPDQVYVFVVMSGESIEYRELLAELPFLNTLSPESPENEI